MSDQARKGRYFPMPVASVLAVVRRAGLRNADGEPLPLTMANPRPSQERESLAAELKPRRGLTLFSLPIGVMHEDGEALWQRILTSCVQLRQQRVPVRPGEGPVYAFLDGLGAAPLRIVARWYHYQVRKYRGTDKFTGGLNRKLLRVEELAAALPTDVRTHEPSESRK